MYRLVTLASKFHRQQLTVIYPILRGSVCSYIIIIQYVHIFQVPPRRHCPRYPANTQRTRTAGQLPMENSCVTYTCTLIWQGFDVLRNWVGYLWTIRMETIDTF